MRRVCSFGFNLIGRWPVVRGLPARLCHSGAFCLQYWTRPFGADCPVDDPGNSLNKSRGKSKPSADLCRCLSAQAASKGTRGVFATIMSEARWAGFFLPNHPSRVIRASDPRQTFPSAIPPFLPPHTLFLFIYFTPRDLFRHSLACPCLSRPILPLPWSCLRRTSPYMTICGTLATVPRTKIASTHTPAAILLPT